MREVSCGGPACVLFELGLKFWSQGGQLFGAFACGVGGFARASLMVKAWRCGNLADAGVGGLGFDGALQAKVRCARNIVVKSEAVHKRGARWRRKLKVDQRARGAQFEICKHEYLKAHAMERFLGGQCAWRHVEVADGHPWIAGALGECQQGTDLLEILLEPHQADPVGQDKDKVDSFQVEGERNKVERVGVSCHWVSVQSSVGPRALRFVSGKLAVAADLLTLEGFPGHPPQRCRLFWGWRQQGIAPGSVKIAHNVLGGGGCREFPRSPPRHKCSAVDGGGPWSSKSRSYPRTRHGAHQE